MKRTRNEPEEEEEEEGNITIKRIKQEHFGILSLPNEILMIILSMLSCCEYNILMLVSAKTKNIVLTLLPIIGRFQSRKIIIGQSSFGTILTNIVLKSLEFNYFSLLNWYNDHYDEEIHKQNRQSQSFSKLAYAAALSRIDKTGINWLESYGYKLSRPRKNCELWCGAIKGGLEKLNWLFKKSYPLCYDDDEDNKDFIGIGSALDGISYQCGLNGDISILEWFHKKDVKFNGNVWLGALKKEHYHVIKWLCNNNIILDYCTLIVLIEKQMIKELDWLFNNEILIANTITKKICFNLKIMELYSTRNIFINGDQTCLLVSFNQVYENAFWHGNLEIIKWIWKKRNTSICKYVDVSVERSCIEILKWANEIGIFPCKPNEDSSDLGVCSHTVRYGVQMCAHIAKYGNLDHLKWIVELLACPLESGMFNMAVLNGHLDVLKWGLEQKCLYNENFSLYAAHSGGLEILTWLHDNGYKISPEVYSISLRNGNYIIYEWAIKNCIPSDNINWKICVQELFRGHHYNVEVNETGDDYYTILVNLIKKGDYKLIEWAISKGCIVSENPGLSIEAAIKDFSILQKLVDNHGIVFTKKTIYKTIKFGNLDNLKWLESRTNPLYWEHAIICSRATRYGKLDIVKYICQKCSHPFLYGRFGNKMCNLAAHGGHWETFQWLLENGFKFDMEMAHFAVHGGQLEILKKMKNLPGFNTNDKKICSLAAQLTHFDILKWARENDFPWDWHVTFFSNYLKYYHGDFWSEKRQEENDKIYQWAKENECPEQFFRKPIADDLYNQANLDVTLYFSSYYDDERSDDDYDNCRN